MGSILSCGPFAATRNDEGCFIVFPINTQGDWVNTDEGHEALEKAVQSLGRASDDGVIHQDTEVEWHGDDQVVVRVPCANWEDAMMKGAGIKELIPRITDAVATDLVRKIG